MLKQIRADGRDRQHAIYLSTHRANAFLNSLANCIYQTLSLRSSNPRTDAYALEISISQPACHEIASKYELFYCSFLIVTRNMLRVYIHTFFYLIFHSCLSSPACLAYHHSHTCTSTHFAHVHAHISKVSSSPRLPWSLVGSRVVLS